MTYVLVIAAGVTLTAVLPLTAVWLVTLGLVLALPTVYDRVALTRRIRMVSTTRPPRADKDIDAGPGRPVVLELEGEGYERTGAFLLPTGDGRSLPHNVLRSEDGATYAQVIGFGGCHLTGSFGTLRLTTSTRHGIVQPARFLRQRVKGDPRTALATHAAALGLLAARHTEPRCLSEVEILDEIEADTDEISRLAVDITFVEHLVGPVKNRRKAAPLDRDPSATARIERWLASAAPTA